MVNARLMKVNAALIVGPHVHSTDAAVPAVQVLELLMDPVRSTAQAASQAWQEAGSAMMEDEGLVHTFAMNTERELHCVGDLLVNILENRHVYPASLPRHPLLCSCSMAPSSSGSLALQLHSSLHA